jgi:ComEC/Rec2-related protein
MVAAMGGIVVSSGWTGGAWIFVSLALLFLTVWVWRRETPWVLLAVFAAFGAAYQWRTNESPAAALAMELGAQRIAVVVEGVVAVEPVPSGTHRTRFLLDVSRLVAGGEARSPRVSIAVVGPLPAPARGDRVRLRGALAAIGPPRNPSEFDVRSWMRLEGVTCELTVVAAADVEVISRAGRFSLPAIAGRCRDWMDDTLRIGIAGDTVISSLISGMVLGVTGPIPESLQEEFRNTGTYHLFSVSGLHVAMIALILWEVLRAAGVGRRTAVCVVIPALFFYALITGWEPPSLRAATTAAIFLVGMVSSRRPVPVNSLSAAGFGLLVWDPPVLFNPGFQLSFFVVFAILLLEAPIRKGLAPLGQPDPFVPRQLWSWGQRLMSGVASSGAGLLSVSLAAWIGSLPLIVHYFHLVSFAALPANLAIVPLAFLILATALVSLTVGVASGWLAAVFNNANWLFTHILLWVVEATASLPGAYVYVGAPATRDVVVTVFDVGAGGATAIEADGRILFYDCGSAFQVRAVVAPWLRSRGRSAPDGLIVSHGDARHIGGAVDLATRSGSMVVMDSPVEDRSSSRGRLHAELLRLGIPKSITRAGDRVDFTEGVSIHILHPPAGLDQNEADDKVVVARLDTVSARVLLVSDAGPATQEWLLANKRGELAADVLVAGRHRSGIPLDGSFLAAVNPALVVSTAGHFPANEPLTPEWCRMIRSSGVRLFRQDETGAVRIEIGAGRIQVRGFFDGREFVFRQGFKPARYAP